MADPTTTRVKLPERLNAWLNDVDEPLWERPSPTPRQMRHDVYGALTLMVVALVTLVMSRSVQGMPDAEGPWDAYGALCLMIAPLAVRRRFPLTVLVVSSGLFLSLSYAAPSAAYEIAFQIAYFAALYAAVAWARNRRALWIAMGLVILTMTLWLVITFTLVSGYGATIRPEVDPDGLVSPLVAAVVYTSLINFAYFGGAIAAGRASWRSALQRARLSQQAERIRAQGDELARRAVVDERLRIARELHDVVAHHVSVIGVQAGAARTVLTRDPEAASEALRNIEGSSRQAVSDMRSLLGVLRTETDTERASGRSRAPEPGLAELGDLIAVHRDSGLEVDLTVVEDAGSLATVPSPVALSLFRTVQESLANAARHSTAARARVTVRTGAPETGPRWVEVEVVDDGQPRAGSAGSGYGLRGIRERVLLHRGEAEVGPRRTGAGWRVRVRLPLSPIDAAPLDSTQGSLSS
ncbi:Signal transduction histidine kinase [Sanguibacter gelidistatuariae]|uniref:histidine kinase n=1 Tax=Sanguibacter gelidistatuariae TaxID=1814289 RepID=A0A1G6KM51_9MICO|nr:sensor histidine kinase [Sanguibacter gelidistatuariae]SDC31908.1 Signal transduction histidine kinase [Sanguibacter gelidistatuariae]